MVSTKPPAGRATPRYQTVVVKFRDGINLPYDDTVGPAIMERGIGPWDKLVSQFPGLTIGPLFRAASADAITRKVQQALEMNPKSRARALTSYFLVRVPEAVEAEAVVATLSSWSSIEMAYVRPQPGPPPVNPNAVVGLVTPPPLQQHLDPADVGIDARYAWLFPGGDGAGQAVVDLEQGWKFDHVDLPAGITLISGVSQDFISHGTEVLGVLAAQNVNPNGCRGVGVAQAASVRCVSEWRADGSFDTESAIWDAIEAMNFGDVLLLETQTYNFQGYDQVPIEFQPAIFDAISVATDVGIVVVEPAGNGGVDLDTVVDLLGVPVFDRAVRDSGAVLVAGSNSTVPHTPLTSVPATTCTGRRVDCFAWGRNVETIVSDPTGTTSLCTRFFAGTSSAAAIVAGAAVSVQGLAQAGLGYRFGARQLRAILGDRSTGTASENGEADGMGVMPNLRAIIESQALNLAPDVYLRDFVGDTGNPHEGPVSDSPDVILRSAASANPQADFGEGSGTENSDSLGSVAVAGRDNFVYVRVRNRGGSDAANVVVTVYVSPVATLVTPDLWTLVGSTTIPSVPAGDTLTVSNAIVWPSAQIPASGHYCFVAIVDHVLDPAPQPASFLNFDIFTRFIRAANNVTWRNVNVVKLATVLPAAALSFVITGAPDQARRMQIEVDSQLPRGSVVVIEMPISTAGQFAPGAPPAPHPSDPALTAIRINANGRTTFEEVAIVKSARIPARLQVTLPARAAARGRIFVRQLFKGREVGRVTWHIR